jgi:hypothetical protein
MSFVPDPVSLSLDATGNPISASIKRFGGDTYTVTANNAQGNPQPPTGRPFRTTSFKPKGSYMTAKLEFSFLGLTANEDRDWRAAFANGNVVVISLSIDGTSTTEDLRVKLGAATVSVAASRLKQAAVTLKNDSLEFISAGLAFVHAVFSGLLPSWTRKDEQEQALVHAEVPKRLE